MSLDPQLAAQLRQIVFAATSTATANEYGETQVGSPATVYCRLEPRVREFDVDAGTVARSTHFLVFDASTSFTPTLATNFWLPGTTVTAAFARRPMRVHACIGEFGELDHFEVDI